MRYKTIGSVLEWVQTVHRALQRAYNERRQDAESERVKMTLDALAKHEQWLAEGIAQYSDDAAQSVLDTWCDYNPQFPLPTDPETLDERLRELDMAGLVDHYVACHRRLLKLYRQLAGEAETPDIEKIFDNLADLELRELERGVQDTVLLQDI